jgi:hypothetical protein
MAFSDEDLKRLKTESKSIESHGVAGHYPLTFAELNSLLERLECAEAICAYVWDKGLIHQFGSLAKAWLASKGEAGGQGK